MFCQNCGKEVEEGDRFCKNCGVLIGYTREEGEPVTQQSTPDQAGTQVQEQSAGQEQSAAWEQPIAKEQTTDWSQTGQQEFVSFNQEESQPSSSKKMVTWIIVGGVAFVGLIALIILLVLYGSASRKARPKIEEYKKQIEKSQDNYGYDDYYDYYDDDYDDYYDDDDDDDYDDYYDDYDDDDSYFSGGNHKPGGEQFF